LGKAGDFVDFLYGGFLVAATILGVAIVWQDFTLKLYLGIALLIAVSSVIGVHLVWHFKKKGHPLKKKKN
jgi:hypothetical protein